MCIIWKHNMQRNMNRNLQLHQLDNLIVLMVHAIAHVRLY